MLNEKFLVLPDSMKEAHRNAFASGNIKNVFAFLRKCLKWFEDDDEAYCRTMITKNPLKMHNNKAYNKDFNKQIYNFLMDVLERQFDKKNDKKYKGDAYAFIGVGYEFGVFSLPKNPHQAYENYNIAAQLGNSIGTFRLAQCFDKGTGVSASPDQSLSFYRCAAKLGQTEAMHTYGMVMCYGYLNAPKDENTGYYYLKVAAKKADKLCPYPLFDLGLFYEDGVNNAAITEDYKYALQCFEKGAKLGDPNCKFKLGQSYEYGDLTLRKNPEKSVKYYKSAADNGSVDAQYLISEYYLTGKSNMIEKSYSKSYQWAVLGATKCHAPSAFKCGEYALTGTGTDKNILESQFWFEIAKVCGHQDADTKLAEVYHQIEKEDEGAEIPNGCCFCLFGY